MSAQTIRYGATSAEWDTFAALSVPMLTVVANPSAPTSPDSQIPPENRGKVPSKFNGRGQVVGIQDWTSKQINVSLLDNLKGNPDLGFCVVTGHGTVAIDVDVTDREQAAAILTAIVEQLGDVPVRRRSNSAKFLVPVKVPGAIPKQVIETSGGRIELLGHGQQFVACGTHPSGVRYEWTWPGGAPAIPALGAEQWGAFVATLAERFAVKPVSMSSPRLKERYKDHHLPIPDAPESQVDQARQYLTTAPRSIKGQGGDDTAYKVACQVREFGLSYQQCCALMRSEAWDYGCGWRESWLEAKPIASAYHYAQKAPGARTPEQLGFQAVKAGPQTQTSSLSSNAAAPNTAARFRTAIRLADMKPTSALWENAIAEGSIFAIGALPGRAKSYAATGLAYALAAGSGAFLGRSLVKDRAAVYVDVERLASTLQRVSVWADVDGLDPAALPLHLTGDFILSDATSVANLIDAVRDLEQQGGRKVGLVVVDSLGAAMYGAELNASGPATLAGHMLRKIRDALACTVGVVAHSPKSGDETVAGSLHFDAIFDSSLFMQSSDDGATGLLYVKKSNALALEEPEKRIPWKRETVLRAAGDRQVKVHRLVAGEALQSAQKPVVGRVRPPTLVDRAMTVLVDMTFAGQPAKYDTWIAEVARYSGAENDKARRADAGRAVKRALAAGRARIEDGGRVQALS